MVEWILILTLSIGGEGGATAITNIPSFASQEDCVAAGKIWLKEAGVYRIVTKDATCVPRPRAEG